MQELTLDDVAQSFEEWRSRRTSQSTPIPTRLWALVAKIKNDYPLSKRKCNLVVAFLCSFSHSAKHFSLPIFIPFITCNIAPNL
jgi:hypothetical protein